MAELQPYFLLEQRVRLHKQGKDQRHIVNSQIIRAWMPNSFICVRLWHIDWCVRSLVLEGHLSNLRWRSIPGTSALQSTVSSHLTQSFVLIEKLWMAVLGGTRSSGLRSCVWHLILCQCLNTRAADRANQFHCQAGKICLLACWLHAKDYREEFCVNVSQTW